MYKILTRIIQNRIKTTLDANQPREQAGFRQGYSTMDQLFTINQLIEKSNEYQLDLCIGFIDYCMRKLLTQLNIKIYLHR